jgi:hypothetical protein
MKHSEIVLAIKLLPHETKSGKPITSVHMMDRRTLSMVSNTNTNKYVFNNIFV